MAERKRKPAGQRRTPRKNAREPRPTVPAAVDALRAQQKAAFVAAYADAGNVTAACHAAGIGRSTHYEWLEADAEYAEACKAAEQAAVDSLEREAFRRAREGVEKPVFQGGAEVGRVREFSDTLLIFLMKGLRPDRYRERATVEHTGKGGGPILLRTAGLTDQELADLDEPDEDL